MTDVVVVSTRLEVSFLKVPNFAPDYNACNLGLSVHMNQVHKETLTHVENAIPGRQSLDIEIFGMEGVPGEIVDQHNQQVTQKHFAEEAERARITGNPVRGLYSNGSAPPNKRAKVKEDLEDIEARAMQFRKDRKNGIPLPVAEIVPNPVSIPKRLELRKIRILSWPYLGKSRVAYAVIS